MRLHEETTQKSRKIPFTDPPRQRCRISHESPNIEGVRIWLGPILQLPPRVKDLIT